jgi:3-hydroxyisobutyrate dehydrogenase-like beta-hydroxyacid dehydrogenase
MSAINKSVGVIGLGIIGSRVAEHVEKGGHQVFVWSRTPRVLPNFLGSAVEVAEAAQVIQIFVRDAEAVLEVVTAIHPALTAQHIVMCHSTVSAEAVRKAAALIANTGAAFLDAPFTGSKMAAAAGQLVYYISGDAAAVEAVRPILELSSKTILTFGAQIGDATILKIATNLISASVVGALAEAAAITQQQGVSLSQLLVALQNNANNSTLIQMKLPGMIAGNYEPHFSLKNMLKDAQYAQLLARDKSISTPVLDATAGVMEVAMKAGHAEDDFSILALNLPVNSEKV